MDSTRFGPDKVKTPLDRCDGALLAAFAVIAVLGIWNNCLLVNDGAILLSAGWLGNAWDLYLNQIASRAVSTLVTFGPAWLARWAFDLSPASYIVAAHILYFTVPLLLWAVIRIVEPHRTFSRLYLAVTLALIYFPTELIVGTGLWMIWAALVADPARSMRQAMTGTFVLGLAIAFTHPSLAAVSFLYALIGVALLALGRAFPRRTLGFATVMATLLLLAYVATSTLLPPTNPTIARAIADNRYDHIDPLWMLATLTMFPMLAALWLLILGPGAESARLRWRLSPLMATAVVLFGLWFAANGTSVLTWLFIRHTAVYVLGLALALALAGPVSSWTAAARRPLMLFAAIMTAAAISYGIDLALFGRFVEQRSRPGIVDVDASSSPAWPLRREATFGPRIYFKWAAGSDYVRDVVVPDYDWYRITLAFHSFFTSDGRTILFHRLTTDKWIPFECAAIERALAIAHDDTRRMFLRFLEEHYCVR